MKKTLKRSLVMILATVLLIGTFAVTADAAMKKTVKKQGFTTSTSTANKKAAKVKKGTTTLTYKKGQGYIKFTAPKTKKYTFTFSNYKLNGTTCGHISVQKKEKNYPSSLDFVDALTKGGKSPNLRMCSVGFPEDKTGKDVNKYLHKRSAKLKLKKGETVYFYFFSVASQKTTMKLVIK